MIQGQKIVTCGKVACFEIEVESLSTTIPWSVTWQRVRGNITEEIDISTEKYKESNDKQLVIHRVSREDEGKYQAVLSREESGQSLKRTSNAIFLEAAGGIYLISMYFYFWKKIYNQDREIVLLYFVVDPPVLQRLNVSTGWDGITLHYQYKVTSDSPNVHHIAWKKNGTVIYIDHYKYLGGGKSDNFLTITLPKSGDAGQYTCIVANAVGAVSESLLLGNIQCLY